MSDDELKRMAWNEARKTLDRRQRIRAAVQAAQDALRLVNTETIVKVYLEAVIENKRLSTDAEAANRQSCVAAGAYEELRRRGEEAALLPLLDHANPAVRVMTAMYMLPIATEKAERVLEEIAGGPRTLVQLGAEMTLKRWRSTGVAVDLDDQPAGPRRSEQILSSPDRGKEITLGPSYTQVAKRNRWPLEENTLAKMVAEVGLKHRTFQICAAAKPCILLYPEESDDALRVGSSRIGGVPDLPPGAEWPSWKGRPLAFIAQFNLAELRRFKAAADLPEAGILSFFYDSAQSTWGFDRADAGSFRVLLLDCDALRTASPLTGLPADALYSPCRINYREAWTLPPEESLIFESWELDGDERSRYYDLLWMVVSEDEWAQRSLLLGHPDQIQGDMQLQCARAAGGLYCSDASGYEDAGEATGRRSAEEWRLLLQIGSDANAGMMWGDMGCLYYWIRDRDLKASNFDNAWMILQCG